MSRKVFSRKVLIKVLVTTNKELCIYIQSQMNKMLNAVITDCFYLLKRDTQTESFVSSCILQFSGGFFAKGGEGHFFWEEMQSQNLCCKVATWKIWRFFMKPALYLHVLLIMEYNVCEVIVLIFSLHNALNRTNKTKDMIAACCSDSIIWLLFHLI